MDEATRASLFIMGDPYAKLSILDDEELAREAATAQRSCAKRQHSNTQIDRSQPDLFAEPQQNIDILWKTRRQVYKYVSEAFALPLVQTRPPELLRRFGAKAICLSPRAQQELRSRIAAHLPDEHIVYNRLPPIALDGLFLKLLEIADAVAALDAQKD